MGVCIMLSVGHSRNELTLAGYSYRQYMIKLGQAVWCSCKHADKCAGPNAIGSALVTAAVKIAYL